MKTNEKKNASMNNSNTSLVSKKEAREIIRLAKEDCSTISGAVRNMCILFKDKDLLRATFLNEKVKNPKAKKRLSEIIKNRSLCVNILSTYSMQLDGVVCKKYVIAKAENGVTVKKYKLPENPLAGVRTSRLRGKNTSKYAARPTTGTIRRIAMSQRIVLTI